MLSHLREEGAHTLGELLADPPKVLHLPLNRRELVAVLDSSYRHGLVAPIPNTNASEQIWRITEAGKRTVRRGMPWLLERSGQLFAGLTGLAGLLGVLGLNLGLLDLSDKKQDFPSLPIAGLAIAAMIGVVLIVAHVDRRDMGTRAKKSVGRDWRRWVEECPNWYRQAFRPFPWRSFLAGLVGVLTVPVALALLLPDLNDPLAVLLSSLPLIFGIPMLNWLSRWDDIRYEQRKLAIDL